MKYTSPRIEIEAGYGGAIAMALLPDDLAEEIVSWAREKVNDDEVFGEDGKGREGSPHITVQNGIVCEDFEDLESIFTGLGPMNGALGPVKVFRMDDKDYDVVHVEVISDDLCNAAGAVADLLEVNSPYADDYKPHITLAYVKKGAGARFEGLEDFLDREFVLDRMVLDGTGIETKHVPLGRVDRFPGGKADDMDYGDFDPKDLEEGAKHELEHTKSIEIAREIAMDHLAEDPDYYRKIKKVEAKKGCSCGKSCKKCPRMPQREPLKESLDYGSH